MCHLSCRPNLGAKAFAAGWYFDFNLAYIGAGFITPISVRPKHAKPCEYYCLLSV